MILHQPVPVPTCCDSCAAGGPCAGTAQLGDLPGFLTGLSLPVLIGGAIVLYLVIAGPGARARRDAISQEDDRHRAAIERIKSQHRRLPSW